jgi:hypothetical protein
MLEGRVGWVGPPLRSASTCNFDLLWTQAAIDVADANNRQARDHLGSGLARARKVVARALSSGPAKVQSKQSRTDLVADDEGLRAVAVPFPR